MATQNAAQAAGARAPDLNTVGLYAAAVVIWGSTWFAITFQLGEVPPSVSVVWRFALATALLFAYALRKRLPLNFAIHDHAWLAAQGLFMFGINYVLVYLAEQYLASGLVAVTFSLFVFFNIVAVRLCFGTPIRPLGMVGAVVGVIGVVLIFWPEVTRFSATGNGIRGLVYAVAATLTATLGSVIAVRNHNRDIPVVQQNAWGMLYGTAAVAVYAALSGDAFRFAWTAAYVISLLYLALFGSVLAFGAYLTVMRRIGADRAGYTSVAVPVVALLLSTLFEALQWELLMLLGLVMCVGGNVLMLARGKADRR
jgi:drug/metabolite transporter (DMT)-like permease